MPDNFKKLMAKAATDANERASFLADPRPYLVANGVDVPDSVAVTAVEIQGSIPTLAFGLPPMLHMDELSDESLAGVYGGKTNVQRPGTGDN